MSRRKKWIDVLFRGGDKADDRAVEDPALAAAHAKAKKPLSELVPVAERLTGTLAHARIALDAVA